MHKLTITFLAGLMAFSVIAPTFSTPAEAGRRGRGVAAGVFLGLTAAAIAAHASRADASEHRRWRRMCDRLAYRCDRGSREACYRFDDQCN